MALPLELYNHVLSFRPAHEVAVMIKKIKSRYETDYMEVPSHQHLVHTTDGCIRMKQYYGYGLCNEVMSFSEYYFQLTSGELNTFPDE